MKITTRTHIDPTTGEHRARFMVYSAQSDYCREFDTRAEAEATAIRWQLYCRDCDAAFESDDRHAELCPACVRHYTHAALTDERNGEEA